MTKINIKTAERYLKQQIDLGIPDIIFSGQLPPVKNVSCVFEPENSYDPVKCSDSTNTHDQKREALKVIYREVKNCSRCPLSSSRRMTVFGGGNASARILVIGEAPGAEEDKRGLPFVGKSGQLLTKMFSSINIDRKKDVFITNILKCRPPGNRNPGREEIIACIPFLKKQIEIIDPFVILVLGRIAARQLLNTDSGLSGLRGKINKYGNRHVIVTYHPSALLRNQDYKPRAHEDLKLLKKLLNKD